MKTHWIVLVALLAGSSQVLAVRLTEEPAPSSLAASQADKPAGNASHADDSSSLREGLITGLSDKRDKVEINGSWLKVTDGVTRMFRRGRGVTRDELSKGQKVRFNLAPNPADAGTLGVVYVP